MSISQSNPSASISLEDLRHRTEAALEKLLPKDLHEPLSEAMRYSTLNGGKRLRALLVYASGIAFNTPIKKLDSVACAVECIHAYSLIDDDLPAMDDDHLRRGKPTAHIQYNEATAILSGDALQAFAFELLSHKNSGITPVNQLKMINLLAHSCGVFGMVGGQMLDINATNNDISLAELEKMHRLKTLIKASTMLGALSSQTCNINDYKIIKEYAKKIGLAFQIVDDILDETADTDTLGKPSGADKALGKSTYISHLGIDNARIEAQKLVNDALQLLEQLSDNTALLEELAELVIKRIN